jgi:hypothetical protein
MKSLLKIVLLSSAIVLLAAPYAWSYPQYELSGTTACATCHSGFLGGPGHTLHDLHTGFVNGCLVCHGSIGDDPQTTKCAQCHVGPGLRLHHVNAPTAPNCTATCHTSDPTPFGENVAPPLYGTASTSLTDPCSDSLDNDGDLKVDGDDPNCTGTAVDGFSWTAFKSLFQ